MILILLSFLQVLNVVFVLGNRAFSRDVYNLIERRAKEIIELTAKAHGGNLVQHRKGDNLWTGCSVILHFTSFADDCLTTKGSDILSSPPIILTYLSLFVFSIFFSLLLPSLRDSLSLRLVSSRLVPRLLLSSDCRPHLPRAALIPR